MTVRRATLYVLLAACCFGSISVLTVLGRQGGATLLTILTFRYAIGALGLMVVSGGARAVRLPRARLLPLLLLGGIGQVIVTFTSLKSLDYIPAATLGFLFYTYPAWVTIFAALRGADPLTPVRVLALLLSLAGITLMVGNPFRSTLSPVGLALALGSAIAYALYIPLINRLQQGTTPAVASTWIVTGAALVLGAMAAATGELAFTLGAQSWAAILTLALAGTVLAFAVFLRGLDALGPVRTAIISTVEPFWTTLLAAVVLAQPLTASAIAGGALIAAAVGMLQGGRK